MLRIKGLIDAEMTEEQKSLAAEIGGPRSGAARGPFPVWLKSPDLIRRVNDLALYFKQEHALPARLRELAILVNARHWTSQYQWHVHQRHALRLGYSQDVLDALAEGRTPDLDAADARAVYQFAREMYEPGEICDATYQAALDAVGEQGVIELVTLLGFYSLIAVSIKGFDVGERESSPSYLAPRS